MFFLALVFTVVGMFFLACITFQYYHEHKTLLLQRQQISSLGEVKHRWKYMILRTIGTVWSVLTQWSHQLEQCSHSWFLHLLTDSIHVEQHLDQLEQYLRNICIPAHGNVSSSEETNIEVSLEISQLTDTIYELYIDPWYQNIYLDTLDFKNADFQHYCKEYIRQFLHNFNQLLTKKLNTAKLTHNWIKEIEIHLKHQSHTDKSSRKLRQSEEIAIWLDLLDDLLGQLLPLDVNILLTSCDCCNSQQHRTGKKSCLHNSNNPARLFIYNLVIYSLMLPLVDRVTHPLYWLFNCLCLLSQLGGLPLHEFVSIHESIDQQPQECASQLPLNVRFVESVIDHNSIEDDILLHEAIEESKNELFIISNIRITSAKVSTMEIMSTSSLSRSINPYIDYTIIYNVVQCDNENSETPQYSPNGTVKRTTNGSTFRQHTYKVKRRFREFLSFQQKLEKNSKYRAFVTQLKNKPSNIQFHSNTFLNYLKSVKVSEDSPLVKIRRDCLEKFLNSLAKNRVINESEEFSEFLGYKYSQLVEVRNALNANASILATATAVPPHTNVSEQQQQRPKAKNHIGSEFAFKDIFKIFLPLKAKYGQLFTQIEDVVEDEHLFDKYLVRPVVAHVDSSQHMVLEMKLDKWATTRGVLRPPPESASDAVQWCSTSFDKFSINQRLYMLISCVFLLLTKRTNFILRKYLIKKLTLVLHFAFVRLCNIVNISNLFRWYLHYLHCYLAGNPTNGEETSTPFDDDNPDPDPDVTTVSYEQFYVLFKHSNLNTLLTRYVRLSEHRFIEQMRGGGAQQPPTYRIHLYKLAFFLCDRLRLVDCVVNSFDDQSTNKALLYKLLLIFRDHIK